MNPHTTSTLSYNGAISNLPLFDRVESDVVRGLIASSRIATYDKGAELIAQGQSITRFYIILNGWCGANKSNRDGQESILEIFSHGDFLFNPTSKQTECCLYNIMALTQVVVLVMPPTLVFAAIDHSTTLKQNMFNAMAKRSRDHLDHIEQLTLRDAGQRVGRFLLQLRASFEEMQTVIDLPFDKNYVASYLGIKPETLSRTLQLFRERGYLIERNQVVTPNFESLCEFCDSYVANSCSRAGTDECSEPELATQA